MLAYRMGTNNATCWPRLDNMARAIGTSVRQRSDRRLIALTIEAHLCPNLEVDIPVNLGNPIITGSK